MKRLRCFLRRTVLAFGVWVLVLMGPGVLFLAMSLQEGGNPFIGLAVVVAGLSLWLSSLFTFVEWVLE